MHAYRFRVLLEDVEDFYRDIEIAASSTFADFHKAIIQSVDFDGKELASFYICDSKWNRKKEITLEDMSDEDEDEDEVSNAPLLMNKCVLAEYIDDPHQRLVYVYDFLNMYEFFIELSKIIPADPKVKYPRCVRKLGIVPKPGSPITSSRVSADFDEEELFIENETSLKDDDDSLGLYTDTDTEPEGAGEVFDDDKF
ncbi:MAG TPA: hypothetical protein PKZ43_05080 [Bacteroidales bacterium]|nr:hypothetical protein [Bacteroidales bacterium]HQH18907.1 hypothetical protein [Bacteroidales bacterium]HQI46687.1 hypothetical protein [Bacteroidales bacterium]